MKTIRLVYPQWQGGDIARWIPEVSDPAVAARGYALGAQLLQFLAPESGQETYTVPVDVAPGERTVTDGVLDRDAIVRQAEAAMAILRAAQPDRVVTIGGECSTSVVPFTYMADRYNDDLAVVWIDAHPDITLPGDPYAGFHAMAQAACMGLGDRRITSVMPARIPAERAIIVGLRDWERDEIRLRQQQLGIAHLSPADVLAGSGALTAWLRRCGASRVAVHFDMDVLDPAEIVAAVGVVPGGMKMADVVRVINDIAREKELVALTVAEPMPRTAIRLRAMLAGLPLMK